VDPTDLGSIETKDASRKVALSNVHRTSCTKGEAFDRDLIAIGAGVAVAEKISPLAGASPGLLPIIILMRRYLRSRAQIREPALTSETPVDPAALRDNAGDVATECRRPRHDQAVVDHGEPAGVEELVESADRRVTDRLTGKARKAYLDGG
jgi:hypothetical protein